MSDRNVYTSDSHFGHANIIRYCERPFVDTKKMDAALVIGLKDADAAGKRIFHGGDIAFNFAHVAKAWGQILKQPENHTFLFGNHDSDKAEAVAAIATNFQCIVGWPRLWRTNATIVLDTLHGKPVRVLLSHAPLRDLQGCDYNVHGHIHNNAVLGVLKGRKPGEEFGWSLDSPVHLNASVELHDYAPVTLETLVKVHEGKYGLTALGF